jgi:hypothetical protein
MIVSIRRLWKTPQSVTGELALDGQFFCYTLEPAEPIANGVYQARVTYSPKFHMMTPRLYDVPGFPNNDIEIHMGNFPDETEGCILVGSTHDGNFVGDSDETLARLIRALPAPPQAFSVSVEYGLEPGTPAIPPPTPNAA